MNVINEVLTPDFDVDAWSYFLSKWLFEDLKTILDKNFRRYLVINGLK